MVVANMYNDFKRRGSMYRNDSYAEAISKG